MEDLVIVDTKKDYKLRLEYRAKQLIDSFQFMSYTTFSQGEKREIIHLGIEYKHALHIAFQTSYELAKLSAELNNIDTSKFYIDVQNVIMNKILEQLGKKTNKDV